MTVLRYIPLAILALVADVLAFILAPIAALPVFTFREGKNEYLVSYWKWITTHDEPVNRYITANGHINDDHWLLGEYTQEQILASKFLSYLGRIVWIWRNPAYQVSHWLGYDKTGIQITKLRDEDYLWDKGYNNCSHWRAVNAKGEKSFLYERQIFWIDNDWFGLRCLELQFGWKLYRNDPDKRCMLAIRFHPFKDYKRVRPKPTKPT